ISSREAWEESANLFMTSEKEIRDYIDVKNKNTKNIVVSIDKQMVTYITEFNHNELENITKRFYFVLPQINDRKLKEKDRLSWVNYEDLKNVIKNASQYNFGRLILPIQMAANVVDPQDPRISKQI